MMNLINTLLSKKFELVVYSTNQNKNWFLKNNLIIRRFSHSFGSFIQRYYCYVLFNIGGFLKLIFDRPQIVMCFETYSIGPVFFYKMMYPKTEIFIHFHEFDGVEQKLNTSGYVRFLQRLENILMHNAKWISHTNNDRINLFLSEHRDIKQERVVQFPNYPIREIWKTENRRIFNSESIKLVYVGALGVNTTYIVEILDWISHVDSVFELTIFPGNIDPEVKILIEKHEGSNIRLEEKIPYYDLPKILHNFDVGLVLYNGNVPNMVFNVPNKVNEYLACGLNVWYSDVLVTTQTFSKENPDYPLFAVDFSKGIQMEVPPISEEPFEYRHWHEDAVKPLMDALQASLNDSVHTP